MATTNQTIGEKLKAKGWQLSVAESCTGGLVCKLITDIAGSSQWFDRGFITYTNESKIALLSVSQKTLNDYGAVSTETAEAMVNGVLNKSQAEIALAITGIAGPGGGTLEKPVGTVCFAWADKTGRRLSELKWFSGDRCAVRSQAADYALETLLCRFL